MKVGYFDCVLSNSGAPIAATITVQIAGTGPGIVPFITFIIIVIALAGMILFFAVAYKKGAQAMPRPQCEIDGTCTPIGS